MIVKTLLIALAVAVGANEVEDEVNQYTLHIHPLLPANLNLTSGELKLFAGHALNMIHAKCPAVDATKIFQAQKYIGKLIAKAGPVVGSSEAFKRVLQTVTDCTKEGVIVNGAGESPNADEGPHEGFLGSILAPFHQMRTFWIQRTVPSTPEDVSEESTKVEDESRERDGYDMSGLVPQPEEPKEPLFATSDRTPIFVPPQAQPRPTTTPAPSIFQWIRGIFQRMGSVFHGMFTYPIRKRRQVELESSEFPEDDSPMPESTHEGEALAFRVVKGRDQDEFYAHPQQPQEDETEEDQRDDDDQGGIVIPVFIGGAANRNPGKAAFARLVDHMCEIYCSTCSHPTEMINFKKAAKQLLIFLFADEDNNALELGANKFLDQEFLNSITDCERGQHK